MALAALQAVVASGVATAKTAPPLYLGTAATIAVMSLLVFLSNGFSNTFQAKPGEIIPPWVKVWTLITAGYIETDVLSVVVDACALVWAAKVLDPAWGTKEFGRFMVVINAISMTAGVFTFIFAYIVSFDIDLLFFQLSGFAGVLGGLLVVHKQLYPAQTWALGGLRVEARLLPLSYVLLLVVLYGFGVQPASRVLLSIYGICASFAYLRFFQPRNGGKGDASEAFTFPDMFPVVMQPFLARTGKTLFRTLQFLKLCPSKAQRATASALPVVLPGVSSADAERRRQKALRDLDSRLQGISGSPAPSAPSPRPVPAPVATPAEMTDASPVAEAPPPPTNPVMASAD